MVEIIHITHDKYNAQYISIGTSTYIQDVVNWNKYEDNVHKGGLSGKIYSIDSDKYYNTVFPKTEKYGHNKPEKSMMH